jgi:hypothetical protein
MKKLTVVFGNYANAPKKLNIIPELKLLHWELHSPASSAVTVGRTEGSHQHKVLFVNSGRKAQSQPVTSPTHNEQHIKKPV